MTVPMIFGLQVYIDGWGLPVLDPYGLTILLGILLAFLFGIPLFVNLIGRLFGASEPLLGVDLKQPKEDAAPWWYVLIWPVMVVGLVFLKPPGESEGDWVGVATLVLIGVLAFGFEYCFKRFGRAFFVGGWLFPKKAGKSAKREVTQ